MKAFITPHSLNGTIKAPSSKSHLHRLLICSAFADEVTKILYHGLCDDIKRTVEALEALSAKIEIQNKYILITPIKKIPKSVNIFCGESGSTLRFLLPLCAVLGINANFNGSGRLPERPINTILELLKKNGVYSSNDFLPLTLSGKLNAAEFKIDGSISSQFVTGLLFSLPLLPKDSKIEILPPINSKPYIDLTISVLSEFGIEINFVNNIIHIKGNQKYKSPKKISADGDFSSAAFFLTGGAISGDVTVSGLNLNSKQGDKKIIEILSEMGTEIEIGKDFVRTKKSILKGIEINAKHIPDLVPILSIAGAFTKTGITSFINTSRLRTKESDRIKSSTTMLESVGGITAETDDGFIVFPNENISHGEIQGFNDHRIVMSAFILGTAAEENISVSDIFSVNKSYPHFFEDFKAIGGKFSII